MLESKTKILVNSVRKLFRRGAIKNIKRILIKTHIADIGALLDELDRSERIDVFNLLDDIEKKAEVLSYVETKNQRELLLILDKNQAQQIVGFMESDDAADLLGGLPKDVSQEILDSMQSDSSEDVADLMRYPEDSAGGLMNTDYFAIEQNYTVAQATERIQNSADENLVTFYIYVVDEDGHLVGVISLKELILNKPEVFLKEIMLTEIISVDLDTDQEEVARVVERYDFLCIPVVDSSNKLEGVITVDDVIDVIRAEGNDDFLAMGGAGTSENASFLDHLRVRLPWLIFSFMGGVLSFFLVRWLGANYRDNELLTITASIPLLLSLGGTTGGQAATVAVGAATGGKLENGVLKHVGIEAMLSLIYSILFGLLSWVSLNFLFDIGFFASVLGLVVALLVFFANLLGFIIPISLQKLSFDPTVASIPLMAIIADITAILILFGLAIKFNLFVF